LFSDNSVGGTRFRRATFFDFLVNKVTLIKNKLPASATTAIPPTIPTMIPAALDELD